MAICNSCGHDRRGNETKEDDIQLVSKAYKEWEAQHKEVVHND